MTIKRLVFTIVLAICCFCVGIPSLVFGILDSGTNQCATDFISIKLFLTVGGFSYLGALLLCGMVCIFMSRNNACAVLFFLSCIVLFMIIWSSIGIPVMTMTNCDISLKEGTDAYKMTFAFILLSYLSVFSAFILEFGATVSDRDDA